MVRSKVRSLTDGVPVMMVVVVLWVLVLGVSRILRNEPEGTRTWGIEGRRRRA